jgi:hypothetical protein
VDSEVASDPSAAGFNGKQRLGLPSLTPSASLRSVTRFGSCFGALSGLGELGGVDKGESGCSS